MVRTRFAPSPTGSLHVGNARIAILNWLFARQNDGVFVLRIEDTDVERNVPGADQEMLQDLRWLGLFWDEGPGQGSGGGEHPVPYRQSDRLGYYAEYAEWLIAAGAAYRCYCTVEELAERREAALASGRQPHYDRTCADLAPERETRLREQGREPAVRFRVEGQGPVRVHDLVRGVVEVDRTELGDFVILRSDGRPTYNFAAVVDDLLMDITHVIRGAAHLSNTPRQVLLYESIGHRPPLFAHVPMVLGEDRQKLSKRHGARPLSDYRAEGFHPDAIVNYLSLLSWSTPSGEEFLSRERLIQEIDLERIGVADAVFDPGKLRWLSARHIDAMPLDALVAAVSPFIDRSRFPLSDDLLPTIVEAARSHLTTFSEIDEQLERFFAVDGPSPEATQALRGDPVARAVLLETASAFAELADWRADAIDAAIRQAGRRAGARGRSLFLPLRLALTGDEHGPPLPALLAVLGRERTLRLLGDAAAPDAV